MSDLQLRADRRLIQRIDEHGDGLTNWELGFVDTCLKQLGALPRVLGASLKWSEAGSPLTDTQRAKADQIDEDRVS